MTTLKLSKKDIATIGELIFNPRPLLDFDRAFVQEVALYLKEQGPIRLIAVLKHRIKSLKGLPTPDPRISFEAIATLTSEVKGPVGEA